MTKETTNISDMRVSEVIRLMTAILNSSPSAQVRIWRSGDDVFAEYDVDTSAPDPLKEASA